MANLSDAQGQVVITAESAEDMAKFFYLHNLDERGAVYSTSIVDIEHLDTIESILESIKENIQKYSILQKPDTVTTKFDCYGTGLWHFSNNIEWFFETIFEDIDSNDNFNDEEKKIAYELKNKHFTATFHIIDAEPGCNFIEKYRVSTSWNPDYQEQGDNHYYTKSNSPYNAKNLIRHGLYSDGEVWDIGYIKENLEYFYQEINNDYVLDLIPQAKDILENKEQFEAYLNTLEESIVDFEIDVFLQNHFFTNNGESLFLKKDN